MVNEFVRLGKDQTHILRFAQLGSNPEAQMALVIMVDGPSVARGQPTLLQLKRGNVEVFFRQISRAETLCLSLPKDLFSAPLSAVTLKGGSGGFQGSVAIS